MTFYKTTKILIIFPFLMVATAPSLAMAERQLTFGLYASDKPTTLVKKFRPFLNRLQLDLSRKLGEKIYIKIKVASSYARGVQNIAEGHVDISRLGPASYVEAKSKSPGLSILAMEAKKGKKQFNGVICVREDSAIHKVGDLQGKRFAFGNKRSTIGRYLSQQYLHQQGLLASDLGKYDYLGRHDLVGTSVSKGQYDAGALKESTFKKLVKKGHHLRVLARFPNVTKPWVARAGLDADTVKALQESLLAMKDAKALKALRKDGFLPGTDADFVATRYAIEQNPDFFK